MFYFFHRLLKFEAQENGIKKEYCQKCLTSYMQPKTFYKLSPARDFYKVHVDIIHYKISILLVYFLDL